jgi:predicted TPR repeat methyltransferase
LYGQIWVELMQQAVSHRVARPYTELAAMYDATLGVPFFVGARKAFEELVRRYGINFRSAADIGCGTGLFARYLNPFMSPHPNLLPEGEGA